MNKKWEMSEYQQMKSVKFEKGQFRVEFKDGGESFLSEKQLLPENTSISLIDNIYFNPYEIVIPTTKGEVEISWVTIRLLTDSDFATYWANLAETEAGQVGLRIKELRKSRKLSSKEVAERAGISPQSLSRIENGHHDVVFTTLKKILAAMGYSLKDLADTFHESPVIGDIVKGLEKVGINKNLIYERIIPEPLLKSIESGENYNEALGQFARLISKIFGISTDEILNSRSYSLDPVFLREPKFKTSINQVEKYTIAYAFYAHYLSLLTIKAYKESPKFPFPKNENEIRDLVSNTYGNLNFENFLNTIWDLGVPVIPLSDPGSFHGACWNISDQKVIVLKQVTSSQGRWLFDLAHEIGHIILHLSSERTSVIEGEEISPFSDSDEEFQASEFATNLLFFGKQEELANKCVEVASGKIEYLKSAVIQVAADERIPIDLLANYIAFRLQISNNINWWGAANNLQITEPSPIKIARSVMMKRLNIDDLSEEDQFLLIRSIGKEKSIK